MVKALKFKVIKSDKQYNEYCDILEQLLVISPKNRLIKDEIELLSLLIEKYDEEYSTAGTLNPVELLKSLMKEHQLKSVQLAKLLGVSEGLVSDILHYRKGFSKETIRILAEHFKLNQKAFNRRYPLK